MFFGSDGKLFGIGDPVLTINGAVLPTCKSYPYLGVELDNRLSLTPHMNKVKKCFGNKLYKLRNLSKKMPSKTSLKN